MTTGQKLVELSGLASGSALAHLLAMQTGTGPGQTIFASMFSVCVEEPRLTLVQRPKREAAAEVEHSALREENELNLSVLTAVPRLSLLTVDECLTVSEVSARNAVVVRLDEGRMTIKQNDVLNLD